MEWCDSESAVANPGLSLQKLFEVSPEPSVVCINDQFVECNQAAVELLGYDSKQSLLDLDTTCIYPEFQSDGQPSVEKLEGLKQQATAEGTAQFEWDYLRPDGSVFSALVTLVALEKEGGTAFFSSWKDLSEVKRLHQSLLTSESRFQELFEVMPNGVIIFEQRQGRDGFVIQNVNEAAQRLFNRNKQQLRGKTLYSLFPEHKSRVVEIDRVMAIVWQDGLPQKFPLISYRNNHVSFWLDIEFYKTPRGELVAMLQDNTDKEQNRVHLELYASVYRQSKQAILISDHNNCILSVNASFTELTGYTEQEVKGHNPRILASGRIDRPVYNQMWDALNTQGYWEGELWDRTKEGRVYPKWITINTIRNNRNEINFYIASFSDISEKKAAERKIEYLAYHDPLTQLLNRFSFEERLGQAIFHARRHQLELAVLLIDLDHFKDINDSLGHALGDELLKKVADRLRPMFRESDIVARLGGDEFIIAMTDVPNHNVLAMKANLLQQRLSQSYELGGQQLFCSPSVGISLFPGDADDVQELIKQADAAMYHAKSQGRKNFQYFSEQIADSTSKRLQLAQELHQAIAQQEFELYYQPKVTTSDLKICGVEALIRWNHPERGVVSPLEFIPALEETGLIEKVGAWVIDDVCRQLAQWQRRGRLITAAVNLSARQLNSGQLITQIKTALDKYQLPASALELEVTETVAMENPEQAITLLNQLCEIGISIAIDDFGTGYSSLAYLKRLPIQTLKLDREFVKDIETDSNNAAISAATIALAHNLGLNVVAEGVETLAQQQFLSQHQCDMLQGYLYDPPQPPQQIEQKWL